MWSFLARAHAQASHVRVGEIPQLIVMIDPLVQYENKTHLILYCLHTLTRRKSQN